MTRERVPRRAMTAAEITMANALGFVRVLPATFDKRIVGELAACARDADPLITERLSLTLRRLVHKYRRQLRADVVILAGERPLDPWQEVQRAGPPDDAPLAVPSSSSPAQLSLL